MYIMKTKRFAALILSAVMMLASFTACGNDKNAGGAETTGVPVSGTVSVTDGTDTPETEENERFTYKSVVIVGVDGMGAFPKDADTPNMDRIFENGAVTHTAQTVIPSISAQAWTALMTGASAGVHGINNDIAEEKPYENDELPTIFKRVREAMPDAVLASYCEWNPINVGIVEQDIGVEFANATDDVLHTDAAEYLGNNTPTLMYIHFDSCDAVGHGNGYGSEKHLEQISVVDTYIGKVYDAIVEAGNIDDTLFIVATDHGGTNNGIGDHGGLSPEEMTIFFGASGKSVKKGEIGEMNIRDVSAIVLYALGLEVPEFDQEGFAGQIPDGVFEDFVPEERREIIVGEYEHETMTTPASDSGKYITDYLDAEKLKAVLHFDDNGDDALGKESTAVRGEPIYYRDGYFDKCIEAGSRGCIELSDIKFGTDSFTVSFWMNHNGEKFEDFVLCGNQDYHRVTNPGFSVVYNGNGITFNIGNKTNSQSIRFAMSEALPFGWTNVTLVVDRAAGTVTNYFNFQNPTVRDIDDSLKAVPFDGRTFKVGNDTSAAINKYSLTMDEFIVYGGTVTADDVAGLAEYFGYKG